MCAIYKLFSEWTICSLFHLQNNSSDEVRCVYWDYTGRGGRGDWSSVGCDTVRNEQIMTCLCNHLTHFAIAKVKNSSINLVYSNISIILASHYGN